MGELQNFLQKLWDSVSPGIAVIWATICWVMFPDAAYIPAAIAVGIAVVLDIITKIYSLAANNGGYIQATKMKVIYSDTLWKKTKTKLIAYFTIMILAGLSIRVTPLRDVGIFLATVIYSVVFIRECQSNIENLIEAGAESLRPLLFWLKKKEKQVIEQEDHEEEDVVENNSEVHDE